MFKAIFEGKDFVEIGNNNYDIKKFSSGIKYLDYEGYRFIEQNRNKPSEWGKKARQGHKIMWIIKGRHYLVRIIDGEYIDLSKK